MRFLLAEARIAHLKAPPPDPSMAPFVARADDLDRLAERSDGFVWRQVEPALALEPVVALVFAGIVQPCDSARLFLTLWVWRDIEASRRFAAAHADVLSRFRQWTDPLDCPSVVLWWVPDSHRPTPSEAASRLRGLTADGPTSRGFDFETCFPAPVVRLSWTAPDGQDARPLLHELDDEIRRRYPGVSVHGLSAAELADEACSFAVAYVDGAPAGCGALRRRTDGDVEVKRMYVRPRFRGLGVAREVLAVLESRAQALGVRRLLIETGAAQPEAIALYRSAGFVDIPRFAEYAAIAASRCFEKRLRGV